MNKNQTKHKNLLFSVTANDCRWDYFRGSGKGGQKKNKTSSAVRCTHIPSKATGSAEDGRSQKQNKKLAFRRMAQSQEFQDWCRIEAARTTGELAEIEQKVDKELENIQYEVHDDKGCWIKISKEQCEKEEERKK